MSDKKRKIGIMGGTFDPIHTGHLATAEAVRVEYDLERVLFIPAANPPHKQHFRVTKPLHRYIMTVMATYSNPHFHVSPIEIERPGLSYAIDTVLELIKQYGDNTEFYFIVGSDTVQELASWKDIDRLLEICHFIAANRPGSAYTLEDIIKPFGEKGFKRIHSLPTPELEISSTDVREKVRQGRSIKYFVPESVEIYICKENLYKE
ncbi:nicotinate-nucleotide adenylyltransferase [Pelosinus fermentans]|uniref:Probable nicotinate-nucleotide adenylyltransferase n=1 Tax=Pelosinus fermentans JBW45 TaxID=1192197 RepID=I9DCN9_9FIRM|nr:nicotinate-nucleotide adenylyltransferase [Pelosinus fermentans]AJQ27116.1 nicotinate-nucleotide adenylyltransferase [Pelosinus fermentans JBW45]